MYPPTASRDSPEEAEIDRLLHELGIELPASIGVHDSTGTAEGKDEVAQDSEDTDPLYPEEPIRYWFPGLPDQNSFWAMEPES